MFSCPLFVLIQDHQQGTGDSDGSLLRTCQEKNTLWLMPDIYLAVGSMESYGASTFLEVQFSNAGCSLFESLNLCISTKLLLLLVNRVDPDRGRLWNSGLSSDDWYIRSSHENSLFLSRYLLPLFWDSYITLKKNLYSA